MIQFSKAYKFILFLSSYVPLFLMLAIELHGRKPFLVEDVTLPLVALRGDISIISILLLILSLLLCATLAFVLIYHSGHRTTLKRCDNFKQRNELLSSYLLVYVFVFIGLEFTAISDVLVFVLFFGMLAILQLNSEMLHINPLLGLRGYRVYEVESNMQTFLVISKTDIRENIIPPESQKSANDPDFHNIELIQLGSSAYLTPTDND